MICGEVSQLFAIILIKVQVSHSKVHYCIKKSSDTAPKFTFNLQFTFGYNSLVHDPGQSHHTPDFI